MSFKYPWNTFPKYTINIGELSAPIEISHFFRQRDIDKYTYCIMFKGIVIKYGMSAPESKSREFGDRVYRQIGHCFTWGVDKRLDGSSGADWLIIERDFKTRYGFDINHEHIKVIVWDVTNYPFLSIRPFREVEEMESELINYYLEHFGEKPIGNINDEANKLNRSFIGQATWDHCFEFAEEAEETA